MAWRVGEGRKIKAVIRPFGPDRDISIRKRQGVYFSICAWVV